MHTSTRFRRLALTLAALLLTAGCAWKGPKPAVAMGDAELTQQVIVLDEECWRSVGLQGFRIKQSPGGILMARIELGNRTEGDHSVELRVLFGDDRGALVGGDPPWENLMVPRASYTIYETHSTAPASMVRVELRSP